MVQQAIPVVGGTGIGGRAVRVFLGVINVRSGAAINNAGSSQQPIQGQVPLLIAPKDVLQFGANVAILQNGQAIGVIGGAEVRIVGPFQGSPAISRTAQQGETPIYKLPFLPTSKTPFQAIVTLPPPFDTEFGRTVSSIPLPVALAPSVVLLRVINQTRNRSVQAPGAIEAAPGDILVLSAIVSGRQDGTQGASIGLTVDFLSGNRVVGSMVTDIGQRGEAQFNTRFGGTPGQQRSVLVTARVRETGLISQAVTMRSLSAVGVST